MLAALAWLVPLSTSAEDIRVSGFVATEARWFVERPAFANQMSGLQGSVILNPEFRLKTKNRADRFNLIPFLRVDGRDARRTHGDIREAYWLHLEDEWEVLVGVNTVFWGVTESRHLVNIINQTDAVEDTDEEDKLGQTMLNLATQQDWGRVEVYIMPGFRERTFPGKTGRLRLPEKIAFGDEVYESDLKQAFPDTALRYSHALGDWDIGAAVFHGTSREPRLEKDATGTLRIPHYDIISQLGIDLQYTQDAWLWKFEAIGREGHGDSFLAAVGGFEYTLFQINETDADLGLLVEYLYDGRDNNRAPATFFKDDVFVAARLALNDTQDTEMLAGAVIDRDDGSTFFNVEFSRRLGDAWKIEADARVLLNVDGGNGFAPLKEDSFVNVRLSRFF